jgi:hypothetical protein
MIRILSGKTPTGERTQLGDIASKNPMHTESEWITEHDFEKSFEFLPHEISTPDLIYLMQDGHSAPSTVEWKRLRKLWGLHEWMYLRSALRPMYRFRGILSRQGIS